MSSWTRQQHPFLPDFGSSCTEYRHSSGLRHLHLNSTAPDMGFTLRLSTPPTDDTGIPHVLEHLSLCGSAAYPVKDPFTGMVNGRTLAHSLNAMTAPTQTDYLFATVNRVDFGNLADLYLDLVFNPLLRQSDFEQEGWRFTRDDDGQLDHGGVVLNEMRGAFSNPYALFWPSLIDAIDPGAPDAFVAGGHPSAVPALSFKALDEFHRRHYQPDHATLITCGPVDMDRLHASVDAALLNRPDRPRPAEAVHDQASARFRTTPLPVEDGPSARILRVAAPSDSARLSVSCRRLPFAKGEAAVFELIALAAAFKIPGAWLTEELERQGVHDLSVSTSPRRHVSLDRDETLLLMHATAPDGFPVCDMFDQAIQRLLSSPPTRADWEAARMSLALSTAVKKENDTPSSKVNLLSKRLGQPGNPLDAFDTAAALNGCDFDPNRLAALFQSWAVAPVQRIITQPDPDLQGEWHGRVRDLLAVQAATQPPIPDPVLDSTDTSQDRLPCITQAALSAITPQAMPVLVRQNDSGVPVDHINVPGSSLGVIKVNFDIGSLGRHRVLDAARASSFLQGVPLQGRSLEQTRRDLAADGVSMNWSVTHPVLDDGQFGAILSVMATGPAQKAAAHVKALVDHIDQMDFSSENQVSGLVDSALLALAADRDQNATRRAQLIAQAGVSARAGFLLEQDLTQDGFLQDAKADSAAYLCQLERLWADVRTCPRRIDVVGSDEFAALVVPNVQSDALGFEKASWTPVPPAIPLNVSPHTSITGSVNRCFRVQKTVSQQHPDFPALVVLTRLLQPSLYEAVREKGGAYGVNVRQDDGFLEWSSYRDPNLARTYDAFSDAAARSTDDWTPDEILRAKISVFKDFSRPPVPLMAAMNALSAAERNQPVDHADRIAARVAALSLQDIQAAARKWLPPDGVVFDAAATAQLKPLKRAGSRHAAALELPGPNA